MKPVKNLLLFTLMISLIFSCRKESFTSSFSAILRTTEDTLHFDTVFTSTGSVSQLFKIVNTNNKAIHISSVKLMGGPGSVFKINVNGFTGPEVNNLDLSSDDSLYVFATVSINPNSANLPFVVRDSIAISYNGHIQWVQLEAYGQNAHFLRNKKVSANEVWNNDLPYVILGGLVIDTNATLTINQGSRIFLHADAPFIVQGTLHVNGDRYDSTRVVFTGDRLDDPYRNYPASYPGLLFTSSSTNNIINYAIIKNAYQAIVAVDPAPSTKLQLNETIVDNAYDAGIVGLNTSISARNLQVSNCGKNILLLQGGSYHFNHCTDVGISTDFVPHKEPVLVVTDFLNQNGSITSNPLNADFRNCIFWGEANGFVTDEVVSSKQGNSFSLSFDHVLWRVQNNPANSGIVSAINNDPPLFDSLSTLQPNPRYRLGPNSPALEKGIATGLNFDLDGNPRPVGLPDLGAYERQ